MLNILRKFYISTVKFAICLIFLTKSLYSSANSNSYGEYIDGILHINIVIKNHRFEPDYIEAPTNQKIKLKISNLDDMIEEFESIDLRREKIIPPGKSITIVLAPLKEGEYNFFGDFHQDTARGILKVK